MAAYATVAQYRLVSGDGKTSDERIEAVLEEQSAQLRALLGIPASRTLTDDQAVLARSIVVDAARKMLVEPSFDGIGEVSGATQASFGANGFSTSYSFANPSGSAYFDVAKVKAFKRLLGISQRVGTVTPSYGRLS